MDNEVQITASLMSIRYEYLLEFLDTYNKTISNPAWHEIIVKIDRNHDEMIKKIDEIKSKFDMNVMFQITDKPRFGSVGGSERFHNQSYIMSSDTSYFMVFYNDEIRFEMKDWDKLILSYKHTFEDDIFCIRTSFLRKEKYELDKLQQIIGRPDNFRFLTKKYYKLMEGLGDFWSSDSWFECIFQYLEIKHKVASRQIILKEMIYNEESLKAGKDIGKSGETKIEDRAKRIKGAFERLKSEPFIEHSYDRISSNVSKYLSDEKEKQRMDNKSEISIILASNRIDKLKGFFQNLKDTVSNPDNIEVIVKIDRDHKESLDYYYNEEYKKLPFVVKMIITDNPEFGASGYGLEVSYNQCFIYSSDSSYFVVILGDEIRFLEKDWDLEILKYKHHFKDDLFRIRTSSYKNTKYRTLIQMLRQPENYAFMTKKLFKAIEGFGDFWALDVWSEPIMQFLKDKYKCNRDIIFKENLYEKGTDSCSSGHKEDKNFPERLREAIVKLLSSEYVDYTYDRIAKKIYDIIKSNNK